MKKTLVLFLTILCLTSQSIQAEEPINTNPLYLYSSNYILIDQETGEVLASQNPDKQVHPASITKALTLITSLELLNDTPLTTEYTVPEEVYEGLTTIASIADFRPGDTLPLSDYLYGIMLPSGADATRIMSMYFTDTPEGLAEEMNKVAEKIGMKNSHFVNTSGLDEDEHYSTVEDLSKLIQYSLKNETFKKYYTTLEHTTGPTAKYPEGIEFKNTFLNDAVKYDFPQLYGAKSGYTELAERSLSSVATDGTMNLIVVSTNAPRENKQNTQLLDHINIYKLAFNNYQKILIRKTGDNLAELDIDLRARPYELKALSDVASYYSKDFDINKLTVKFDPEPELKAPIEKGTLLGRVHYMSDQVTLYSEDIFAVNTIQKSLRYVIFDVAKIMIISLLVIILILIIAILSIRHYRLYLIRKKRRYNGFIRKPKK
ncbi:MAG: D-alanyl-D-alanine carboxypeptidase [Erysipelothrix sp.]|nr:D-alanyl-D-alanine carboxypeptidase [Erysipelothrix sp.]